MFLLKYFAKRFFPNRYFPGAGATPTTPTVVPLVRIRFDERGATSSYEDHPTRVRYATRSIPPTEISPRATRLRYPTRTSVIVTNNQE